MVWLGGAPLPSPGREEKDEQEAPAPPELVLAPIPCPRCNETMHDGVLEASYHADGWQHHGASRWRGIPVDRPIRSLRQLFARIKEPYRPPPRLKVSAYRCASCGYLELYAK